MKVSRLSACAVLIVATVTHASSAQAKGAPIVAIGLSGSGLAKEVVMTDEDSLNAFMDGWWSLIGFEEGSVTRPSALEGPIKPLGERYVLTRYEQAENASDGRIAADQLHYFPSRTGAQGYTFFVGSMSGGYTSEFDGKWFRPTRRADMLMRSTFERFKVHFSDNHAAPPLTAKQRNALIASFVAAFNKGDVDAALAMLTEDATMSDCDFAKAGAVLLEDHARIRAWLEARAADRDQLTVAAAPVQLDWSSATLSPVAEIKLDKRASGTLAGLGFKRGVRPQTPVYAAFDPAARRISALWLAPLDPDQAHLCWKFRAVR